MYKEISYLAWLIKALSPLSKVMGHAILCILLSYFFYLFCIIQVLFLKNVFYQIVGLLWGMEPTLATDDFFLYDYPINPMNVPTFMITERFEGNPDEFKEFGKMKLGRGHRCFVKLQKYFGKYFFVPLTDEEYEESLIENGAVLYDVKTDD